MAAHRAGIQGIGMGVGTGALMGFATSYTVAKQQGMNPWTGKYDNSVAVGRIQDRVNMLAKDVGAETITDDWSVEFGKSNVPKKIGLDYNNKWFNSKLENNYNVYDFGRNGLNYGPNYGLESMMLTNYPNVINTNTFTLSKNLRVIIYK